MWAACTSCPLSSPIPWKTLLAPDLRGFMFLERGELSQGLGVAPRGFGAPLAELHLFHPSPSLAPPKPHTPAVSCPDVRRRARGGERRPGAEPQPGDRCEAAGLYVGQHLAPRDQPHELPAHGEPGAGRAEGAWQPASGGGRCSLCPPCGPPALSPHLQPWPPPPALPGPHSPVCLSSPGLPLPVCASLAPLLCSISSRLLARGLTRLTVVLPGPSPSLSSPPSLSLPLWAPATLPSALLPPC